MQKTVVTLICDLCESDREVVSLTIRAGKATRVVDLCDRHAKPILAAHAAGRRES